MAAVNPGWLAFLRVNVASIALLHFWSLQPDFDLLFSYRGYVYPDILDATHDHVFWTLTSLQQTLAGAGLPLAYESLLLAARWAYPLCLLLLGLGLFTRVAAVGALLLQLLFTQSIHLYQYGADAFTTVALFYCCVFPVGSRYALDLAWQGRKPALAHQGLFLTWLRAHLGLAYFFSGLDKVIGPTWRNGEAIWKALHSHAYFSVFSLDFLVRTPFFLLVGWLTVGLEMGYALGMNYRRSRPWWLLGIVGMHLGIGLFMGLFFFSALMIVLNLAAYYAPTLPQTDEPT
ncbi:hypothetical protein GCM10011383_16700 [Hymenobacter cavernae]|uniref:HTTM-like domain-containing protein n=2 Tax=Hymenobacter cavernae TaxID=2044852 RepID=A0ABQ1TXS2_9BACT|nr:hypothetical protein GCM10011383_16700 [Hymenobacter cavernae]